MVPGQAPAVTGPRIGLVLGAGGVLGAAWMTGVLPALQQRLPCALSSADVIVDIEGYYSATPPAT